MTREQMWRELEMALYGKVGNTFEVGQMRRLNTLIERWLDALAGDTMNRDALFAKLERYKLGWFGTALQKWPRMERSDDGEFVRRDAVLAALASPVAAEPPSLVALVQRVMETRGREDYLDAMTALSAYWDAHPRTPAQAEPAAVYADECRQADEWYKARASTPAAPEKS